MKKILFIILFLSITILPIPLGQVNAQTEETEYQNAESQTEGVSKFKAKILKIEEQVEKQRGDGGSYTQQNLRFLVIDGPREGEEATYYGISDIEVGDANLYKVGDKVFVDGFIDEAGTETFYVVDYIRSGPMYLLVLIFIIFVILVGRFKGVKALLSLIISFVVIIKFILPQILNGRDPFIISLIGGLLIMFVIIYVTEGINRKSHIAIFSVFLSLIITLALSIIFTSLTRLTGLSSEETLFLIGAGQAEINFRGLLLAGMLIGAIGVLDDIILGQIEAVDSIKIANPKLPPKQVFKLAYKIGNTHLGAIVNTLFLTYAGAALPLLMLFVINQNTGLTLARTLNTEIITTEIVRTLVGSIGVMASMPIATFLAAFKSNWTKKKN